jgi:hypothetical protein
MGHLKIPKDNFADGGFDMGYASFTLEVNLHLVMVQQPKQFQIVSTLMSSCTVQKQMTCQQLGFR